jgi:hypothetical protein
LQEESNWVDSDDEAPAVYVELDPEAEEPWATMEDVSPTQSWSGVEPIADTIIDVEIIPIESSELPPPAATIPLDEETISSALETLEAWIETDRILGLDQTDEPVDDASAPAETDLAKEMGEPLESGTNWVDDHPGLTPNPAPIEEPINPPTESSIPTTLLDSWLDDLENDEANQTHLPPNGVEPIDPFAAEGEPAATPLNATELEATKPEVAEPSSNPPLSTPGWDILNEPDLALEQSEQLEPVEPTVELVELVELIEPAEPVEPAEPAEPIGEPTESSLEPAPLPIEGWDILNEPSPTIATHSDLESSKQPLTTSDRHDEEEWDTILDSADAFRGRPTPSVRHPSRLGVADEEEWF